MSTRKKRSASAVGNKKSASRSKRKKKKSVGKRPGPLLLDKQLSVESVTALRVILAQYLQAGTRVVVDASAVESADTAALQLLVAFKNRIGEQSRELVWRNPSARFLSLARLVGLDTNLGIDAQPGSEPDNGDDGLCPVF